MQDSEELKRNILDESQEWYAFISLNTHEYLQELIRA